jgi:hypothetical protein
MADDSVTQHGHEADAVVTPGKVGFKDVHAGLIREGGPDHGGNGGSVVGRLRTDDDVWRRIRHDYSGRADSTSVISWHSS